MITVHHLEISRSMRILWLLEELGLAYEVKRYERDRATYRAPKMLREIHPLGKSPIVVDGSDVLVESGVIIDTLLDRYGGGKLRPPQGTPDYDRYRYWLHYAEGSLMPNLLMQFVFAKIPSGAPALIKPLVRGFMKTISRVVADPEVRLHLGWVESQLAGREWFVGNEVTGADVQMIFPLEQAASRHGNLGPNTAAFVARVQARPAYQRARARAGA